MSKLTHFNKQGAAHMVDITKKTITSNIDKPATNNWQKNDADNKNVMPKSGCKIINPIKKYDLIVSRAFSSIKNIYSCCHHLINDNGAFLAMKGINLEIDQIKNG